MERQRAWGGSRTDGERSAVFDGVGMCVLMNREVKREGEWAELYLRERERERERGRGVGRRVVV